MSAQPRQPPPADRFGQLIRQVREGSKQAAAELIAEYHDYLLLIANQSLEKDLQGKLAPSDIVQQTTMTVIQEISNFGGENERSFRAWLRKILTNDLRDSKRRFHAQRRQVKREISLDDSRQGSAQPADREHTPGTRALLTERVELLNRAVGALPDTYQQIVRMRNWQELTFKEIGQQMNCSEDAARKTWYRAIVMLQEVYQQSNQESTQFE